MDEDAILIRMLHEDAKKFARLLRMVGSDVGPAPSFIDCMDNLAISLGSHLNITSNGDEQDELDEGLSDGDSITWQIYDAHSLSDHVNPTEETVIYRSE
jgi:hypothetical protein